MWPDGWCVAGWVGCGCVVMGGVWVWVWLWVVCVGVCVFVMVRFNNVVKLYNTVLCNELFGHPITVRQVGSAPGLHPRQCTSSAGTAGERGTERQAAGTSGTPVGLLLLVCSHWWSEFRGEHHKVLPISSPFPPSPLHLASLRGHTDVLEVLLK